MLHLKAELQDRDAFHRVISGKGHMRAYKIIPESSAFVLQLSPNGAIVPQGSWHPDFSRAALGTQAQGGQGQRQPATSPGKHIYPQGAIAGPRRSDVSMSRFSHGEKRPAGTVGASSLPSHPLHFSDLLK